MIFVLDIIVNFMLNKRKSKKAAGASPQAPLGQWRSEGGHWGGGGGGGGGGHMSSGAGV